MRVNTKEDGHQGQISNQLKTEELFPIQHTFHVRVE